MGFITAPADGAEMSSSTSTAVFWKLGILVAMATAVAAISYYQLQDYAVTAAEQQQRAQQQQMIPVLVLAHVS